MNLETPDIFWFIAHIVAAVFALGFFLSTDNKLGKVFWYAVSCGNVYFALEAGALVFN